MVNFTIYPSLIFNLITFLLFLQVTTSLEKMISSLEMTFSMNSFSLRVWNFKFPHVSIFSSHTILLSGNAGPPFMPFLALLYFLSLFFVSPAGEFSVSKLNENLFIIISGISFIPAGIYLQRDCHLSTLPFVKNFKENPHLQQPNWSLYLSQLCLILHLCS